MVPGQGGRVYLILKTIYVPHNGDLYEVVCHIFDGIQSVTVYRDNCNRAGEKLDLNTIPDEVSNEVQTEMVNWFHEL